MQREHAGQRVSVREYAIHQYQPHQGKRSAVRKAILDERMLTGNAIANVNRWVRADAEAEPRLQEEAVPNLRKGERQDQGAVLVPGHGEVRQFPLVAREGEKHAGKPVRGEKKQAWDDFRLASLWQGAHPLLFLASQHKKSQIRLF